MSWFRFPFKARAKQEAVTTTWQESLFEVLKASGVKLVSYVPDAGHAHLIARAHEEETMRAVVLTTEEEGVAFACGAALGGERSVLLMQSSGVGNCINMLSLLSSGRFPFLTIVTMRGEWAEFNPWQVPMSKATQSVLEAMGVSVYRVSNPDEVASTVEAAARFAFDSDQAVAVLLSQRLIGRKQWTSEK
jgi:sulfopyruvate decarboxylase alpha subunit